MGLALENIGQRDGRSAHIAVFGSSLVELPQVYRAAADRYDLIEVDIGLLPAPRRVENVADAQRTSEFLIRSRYGFVMAPEALGLLPDTLHSLVVFFRGVGLVDIPGALHPRRPCRDTTAVTALKPDKRDIIDQFGSEARPLSETLGVLVDAIGFHCISDLGFVSSSTIWNLSGFQPFATSAACASRTLGKMRRLCREKEMYPT